PERTRVRSRTAAGPVAPRPRPRRSWAWNPRTAEGRPTGRSIRMLALTVKPRTPDSLAVLEVPDPEPGPNELLVDGIALGVCGTDVEISLGDYGTAPEGRERLVLGHESFGRVRTAPEGSGFAVGDLVVGVVRRPDPEPCQACA